MSMDVEYNGNEAQAQSRMVGDYHVGETIGKVRI
jgi:hypothetical protein